MPPRFEFNASDALLQLAQRAGEGQNFDKRFAQGQQLVEGVRRQQVQQDALRLQAEQLQLQAQQRRRGQATPTPQSRPQANPFTRSAEEANAEFKSPTVRPQGGTPGAGTVSGGDTSFSIDNQGNITGTQGGQDLTLPEIRQRGGFVTGRTPVSPINTAKQNFINQRPDLSPEAIAALQPFVDDPSIDLRELGIEANRLKTAAASQDTSRNQQVGFERSFIREQADDIDRRIRAIEKVLGSDAEKINVAGRDLSDVFNELSGQEATGIFGTGGVAPRPKAQALVRELQELRLQKNQLRSQEESLISQDVSRFSPTTPTSAGTLQEQSTDDLLRELLGQ